MVFLTKIINSTNSTSLQNKQFCWKSR